ncbi:hypothetical protein P8452_42441 [Trifolium repens]|nr:hypothetical protein P8452_42441 [Trifolium repens]
MFSINPNMYVGLRNPKNHLKTSENAKLHLLSAHLRPGAARPRPGAAGSSSALTRTQLRSGAAFACAQAQPACCLQPAEPSPGLFLQQHHFQGNIQHL